MTSPSEEFAKYPYYDAKIQKNQAYRPDDGEHIKPIGYFSEIKGTTVIKIATSIFIKDLRLCIPPLLGIIAVWFFIVLIIALPYFSLLVANAIGISSVFVFIFIEGWTVAASSNAIRMESAKIGKSLLVMFKKFPKLLAVAAIYLFLISLVIAWTLLLPEEAFLRIELLRFMTDLIGILFNVLFMFLIPLLMISEQSFVSAFTKSVRFFIKTMSTDPSFTLILIYYYIFGYYFFYFTFFYFIFFPLVYPVIVLARVLYLKVNFSIF